MTTARQRSAGGLQGGSVLHPDTNPTKPDPGRFRFDCGHERTTAMRSCFRTSRGDRAWCVVCSDMRLIAQILGPEPHPSRLRPE